MRKIGIIGGTGVEDASCFGKLEPLSIETPFGTAHCLKAVAAGHEIYFLARHGAGHSVPPHKINYRANIFALKSMGGHGNRFFHGGGQPEPGPAPEHLRGDQSDPGFHKEPGEHLL